MITQTAKELRLRLKTLAPAGGYPARVAQLAFALFRGRAYRTVEFRAHNEDLYPPCRATLVEHVAHFLSGSLAPVYRFRDTHAHVRPELVATVAAWMAEPAPAELVARVELLRACVAADKAARRAARAAGQAA